MSGRQLMIPIPLHRWHQTRPMRNPLASRCRGHGDVWKARDTRPGRIVAIKKVKEQYSERFKQEARPIAVLNNIAVGNCELPIR